tara:strand:- start:259 stop:846 length:588 start_codon:yes stop_codon:yes gene_type:complete
MPNILLGYIMNEWVEQYKQYHANLNTNYPGNNLKPQLQHIKDLVQDTKAETLLDFGCGKGLQYTKYKHHEELGVMPSLYDPGVPEYDTLPEGIFDGVYSTDVMEHIPKEQIPETFETIFEKAERFVFLAICTQPAIAILPNGDNAHCTIEPIGWWVSMIEKYAPKRVYTHLKTYGNCNNYEILNEDLYLEWFLRQ